MNQNEADVISEDEMPRKDEDELECKMRYERCRMKDENGEMR